MRQQHGCSGQQLLLPGLRALLQGAPDQCGGAGCGDGAGVWRAARVAQHRPDDREVAAQLLGTQILYGTDEVLTQLGKAAAQLNRAIFGQSHFHAAVAGPAFAKAIAAMNQRQAHAMYIAPAVAMPAMRPAP